MNNDMKQIFNRFGYDFFLQLQCIVFHKQYFICTYIQGKLLVIFEDIHVPLKE
jgi:hypothetical protein